MQEKIKELEQMQNCLARFSDLTIHEVDLHEHVMALGIQLLWLIARMEAREEMKRMNNNVVYIPKHYWRAKR